MLMDRLLCYTINSICCLLYRRKYQQFISANDIKSVQKNKLNEIIRNNQQSLYGRKYGFCNIRTVRDFQENVPLTTYEDYIDFIDKIKSGEKNVLTAEDVLLFEPTSGTTTGSKYIPYTASLKKEFQSGIQPWIYDVYQSIPEIKWGKSYWSITPATMRNEYTSGGIPIGFEEDSEYFGLIEQHLMNRIFAVDSSIAKEKDIEQFYFKTAVSLLKCTNLTFISIWNPSFLLILMDYIYQNRAGLLEAIPKRISQNIKAPLEEKAFGKVWTRLRAISCWCDASAQSQAEILEKKFPNVTILPKGLLSTECFATLPFVGEAGARLSIFSHFFEFENTENGKICLAHQLEQNHEYSLIVTTGGGFYRYRTDDVVRVVGYTNNYIPLFLFIGRTGNVSDLHGEKLSELFLKNCIEKLPFRPEFYMFAPESDRYVLYIKTNNVLPDIDNLLRENFHYDYCRKLGQLKKMKIFRLTGYPEKEYINHCAGTGQRIGDIKTVVLSKKSGWDNVFTGCFNN